MFDHLKKFKCVDLRSNNYVSDFFWKNQLSAMKLKIINMRCNTIEDLLLSNDPKYLSILLNRNMNASQAVTEKQFV